MLVGVVCWWGWYVGGGWLGPGMFMGVVSLSSAEPSARNLWVPILFFEFECLSTLIIKRPKLINCTG